VSNLDTLPTLLSLAGLAVPTALPGRDLAQALVLLTAMGLTLFGLSTWRLRTRFARE